MSSQPVPSSAKPAAALRASWRRSGLRMKLLAALAPAIMLLVFTIQAGLAWRNYTMRLDSASMQEAMLTDQHAEALSLPLWNLDDEYLTRFLAHLPRNPVFLSAEILDPEGREIRRSETWREAAHLQTYRRPITVTLNGRTRHVGDLVICFSRDGLVARLWSDLRLAGASALAVLIGLGLILYLALNRFVFRPLHLVGGAIQQVERKNWSRVPWKSRDEIGTLIGAFNRMVDSLERGESAERRLRENEARYAQALADEARAEAASRAKSEFLANMSHELRTPLNAIIGYAEMLREDAELEHQTLVGDIDSILGAGRHLLGLINDVLDLSKIEAGRMEILPERVVVSEMLADVLAVIQPLINRNGNRLIVEQPTPSPVMQSDLIKIRQCLLNLLGNASKFTHKGDVRLTVQAEEDAIAFIVTDTGIGMTDEQMGRLFSAFVQGDASTTRRYGGTGLGLKLTRSFADMLGGSITVTSVMGSGSTFTLTLPRICPEMLPTPPVKTNNAGPRVLVIDDDPAVHDWLEREIGGRGFRLLHARSGQEGITVARRERPDAVLLDVIMPHCDGWAVLTTLKGDPDLASLPVVVMSVADQHELGFVLGADEFLAKPFDIDAFKAALGRLGPAGSAQSVLLVDDDAASARTIARLLRRQGLSVQQARNGIEALSLLEQRRFGLVLLDLIMPELDGFGFLAEVRNRPGLADIPVIALTAKDLTPSERQMLQEKAQKVLQKGAFRGEDLVTQVVGRLRGALDRPTQEAGG